MIYTQKIHTDLQINTLEDLAKLKPFLGGRYIESK